MPTGSFESTDIQPAVLATNNGGGDAFLAVVSSGNGVGVIASGAGSAIAAVQSGPGLAGSFDGDVTVSGDLAVGGDATVTGNIVGGPASLSATGTETALSVTTAGDGNVINAVAGPGNGVVASANGRGAAVAGIQYGSGLAGDFSGNVGISGTLTVGVDIVLASADCAEDFDVAKGSDAEPGSVMVLGADGALVECSRAHDTKVVGVISGAGEFKPALILDKRDTTGTRRPVALLGKVSCKVDADYGEIEVGDLLTTSPTPGHAMKVTDVTRAYASIIGKALRPMKSGRGLLPMLVSRH